MGKAFYLGLKLFLKVIEGKPMIMELTWLVNKRYTFGVGSRAKDPEVFCVTGTAQSLIFSRRQASSDDGVGTTRV